MKNWKTTLSAICALVLILMMAVAPMASAESTQAGTLDAVTETQSTSTVLGKGGKGMERGMTAQTLTDEQKAALADAQAAYDQAEDEALSGLVMAGVLTQINVDNYIAQRTAQRSISDLDQSQWTVAQAQSLNEALKKTGDERTGALTQFVTDGLLTQQQADALANAEAPQNVWSQVNASALTDDQKSAVQLAQAQLNQARATYQLALTTAGIQGGGAMNRGFGIESRGFNGPQGNSNRAMPGMIQGKGR